ncbi:sialate O-acetylesterase [Novosphingobium colocasiae]|nr:sialate O-acetylesterase [Novosphingobium colocasiae]
MRLVGWRKSASGLRVGAMLAVAGALCLSGCGGSDGGSTPTPTPSPTPTPTETPTPGPSDLGSGTDVQAVGADWLATFTDPDGTRYRARQLGGTSGWLAESSGPVEAILGYGQSNATGAGLSEPDKLGVMFPRTVVMLTSGPEWQLATPRPAAADSFVSLASIPTSGTLPGALDSFAAERAARDAGRSPAGIYQFTVSAAGQSILSFMPGRSTYQVLMENVRQAKAAAQRYGRGFEVRALIWTQGENSTAGYADDLRKLIDAVQGAIMAITGQTRPPEFMIRQTAGATAKGPATEAAQAQWTVARERLGHGVTLIGPLYQGAMSDQHHYTTESRMMFADLAALAMESVRRGEVYQPVWPLSVTRVGRIIDVRFNVRGSGLQFDRDRVPATESEGFRFEDATGVIAIASVAILGTDTVRVTLDQDPAAGGGTLSYAMVDQPLSSFSGTRGTLYSQEDGVNTVFGRLGYAVPVHPRHYAIRFEMPTD